MFDFQCAIFLCFQNSYLSTTLKSKFDHTAETVLPTLINLISNSERYNNTTKNWWGCDTELVRLQYYSIARLRYRIGQVTILQYCKVAIQNWQGCDTELGSWQYSISFAKGCDKVLKKLLYHCWLTCRNWKECCVWVSVAKQLWQRW